MNFALQPFPQSCLARQMPLCSRDPATGLLSRNLFGCTLDRELARVWPRASALLLIDLGNFTNLAQTVGQPVADAALAQLVQRLTDLVPRRSTLGRLDSNTLALLLAAPDDVHQVTRVAAHIRRALEQPFEWATDHATLSACVGIATCPADADNGAALVAHAGIALDHARASGSGVCCFYTASMAPRSLLRHTSNPDNAAMVDAVIAWPTDATAR
jgi:diguanylate cyclase (GGDEF)-like protein